MRGPHLNVEPHGFVIVARTLHVCCNTICVAVWLYRARSTRTLALEEKVSVCGNNSHRVCVQNKFNYQTL
jgi:hypothetical protein